MSTLTTLDGLEDGTELCINVGESIERWTIDGDRLRSSAGSRLPMFFFTGMLRDGKIMVGNFSPPEVGEWFAGVSRRSDLLMVVSHEGDMTQVALFRNHRFYTWQNLPRLVDVSHRIDAPEWSNLQLTAMTTYAHGLSTQLETTQQQVDSLRSVRSHLRYAADYIQSARTLLGERG